jgi:integrase
LLFLYNTGARVSETLGVCPRELRLDRPRQARLHGKGGEERLCPLWPETDAALRQIVDPNSADQPVFRNAYGAPLTRDGVAYPLDKYVHRASETLPDLRTRHVTPHALRQHADFPIMPIAYR